MYAFTVSNGVAGFLTLALEIAKILNGYISDVKSASKEAEELTEVDDLCQVLKQLTEFLNNEDTDGTPFEQALCTVIKACETHIQALYKTLLPLRKTKSSKTKASDLIQRFAWPFQKDECQQTVQKLHRFAQTFQFSLVVSNW